MAAQQQWRLLVDHVMSIPERVYEGWDPHEGWDNNTQWGKEFGENLVPWCVIWAWDQYHDAGFASVVPKLDNVVVFSDYAKSHGQWSEYPSIGAWTNFGNGHCEVVVGFDANNVYTKGGNSLKSGAVDNGQGNGVWSHSHARRDAYVVGYFAPRFADGACPPTADPADPRGGKAVESWRWSTPMPLPTPVAHPLVSLRNVIAAAKADPGAGQGHTTHPADVRVVEAALEAEGLLPAAYAKDGSFGTLTVAAYSAWQKAYSKAHNLGWTGVDINGIPGEVSLKALGTKHHFTVVA